MTKRTYQQGVEDTLEYLCEAFTWLAVYHMEMISNRKSEANNSIIYAHAKFHEALYVIQNRKSASHKATGKESSDAGRQRKKKVK